MVKSLRVVKMYSEKSDERNSGCRSENERRMHVGDACLRSISYLTKIPPPFSIFHFIFSDKKLQNYNHIILLSYRIVRWKYFIHNDILIRNIIYLCVNINVKKAFLPALVQYVKFQLNLNRVSIIFVFHYVCICDN